jgi:predicted component of type VI protein secretion system
MPAQLLPLNEGPSILLDKGILLIGRHPECDIQIDSRKVSRRHCCIAQVGEALVVRDLGSTNGIRINGVRVLEGRLKSGDELTIGNSRFQVRWDALAAGPGARSPVAREPVRPALPVALPDDLLERCDDPVPLDDPDASPVPLARGRKPGQPPNPAGQAQNPDIRHAEPSERPILPDELELAPASDLFPNSAAPSHHPE